MLTLCLAALVAAADPIAPTDAARDTIQLDAVTVNATRATERTPLTFSTVKKEEISRKNTGVDLPFLLNGLPSVVVTSDAGAGVGYTSIRIRGTDPTRINVTANDIPIADAESQAQFWVNVPDLAASVEDIQVQRGVGSSTHGAGSFGGAINMRTALPAARPSAAVEASYGSYNTHREMVYLSTGAFGRFSVDARLSNVHSDGYIDRATTDLGSFFTQAAYTAPKTSLRLVVFGGKERTYHAWNGIDRAQLEKDRRYNPAGEIEDENGKVIGFYDNQTDNYFQTHYQLLFAQQLAPRWKLNINAHYTDGNGYYEEYKNRRTLVEYGLQPFYYEGKLVEKSNLVRRKAMDNGFGGGVFSVAYRAPKIDVTLGGAANRYGGEHFGTVEWVQKYVGDWQPGQRYYQNRSVKDDANLYLKATWQVLPTLSLYADAQYRFVHHTIRGANDKWDFSTNQMQALEVDRTFGFFNPKGGLRYAPHRRHALYASVGVAHKEPTRNNYTDNGTGFDPKAERLIDYELGYTYLGDRLTASATFYYMDYKDQLVLTGRLNDIGEPLTENVAQSYRLGVELAVGWQAAPWLKLDGALALSRNRILDYTEYVDDYTADWDPLYTQTPIYIGDTEISFSPSVVASASATFAVRGWSAVLAGRYVGQQYMTNSMQSDVALAPYATADLMLGYTFRFQKVARELTLSLGLNNLTGALYESNGWGGSSLVGGERQNYAGFFPQAPFHMVGRIAVRF